MFSERATESLLLQGFSNYAVLFSKYESSHKFGITHQQSLLWWWSFCKSSFFLPIIFSLMRNFWTYNVVEIKKLFLLILIFYENNFIISIYHSYCSFFNKEGKWKISCGAFQRTMEDMVYFINLNTNKLYPLFDEKVAQFAVMDTGKVILLTKNTRKVSFHDGYDAEDLLNTEHYHDLLVQSSCKF